MDQDLLDNIEAILDFEFVGVFSERGYLNMVVHSHWGQASPLFARCGANLSDVGCLTQVKAGSASVYNPFRHQDLEREIRANEKIASSVAYILPEELRNRTKPLSPEDREKVRAVLLPYAEMQMKVRAEYAELHD